MSSKFRKQHAAAAAEISARTAGIIFEPAHFKIMETAEKDRKNTTRTDNCKTSPHVKDSQTRQHCIELSKQNINTFQ